MKPNRRRLNEQADDLTVQVLGALQRGLGPRDALWALRPEAVKLINERWGSLDRLHQAFAAAVRAGDSQPFDFNVRKSFRAALPRILDQLAAADSGENLAHLREQALSAEEMT